jgi:hypothetical protein
VLLLVLGSTTNSNTSTNTNSNTNSNSRVNTTTSTSSTTSTSNKLVITVSVTVSVTLPVSVLLLLVHDNEEDTSLLVLVLPSQRHFLPIDGSTLTRPLFCDFESLLNSLSVSLGPILQLSRNSRASDAFKRFAIIDSNKVSVISVVSPSDRCRVVAASDKIWRRKTCFFVRCFTTRPSVFLGQFYKVTTA